jgi:hypothetical protein
MQRFVDTTFHIILSQHGCLKSKVFLSDWFEENYCVVKFYQVCLKIKAFLHKFLLEITHHFFCKLPAWLPES